MERLVLLFGGMLTAGPLALAFFPTLVRSMLGLEYIASYTILLQHWGFMVGLLGLCMMVAAFVPEIRRPVMAYAAAEKMCIVALYLQYRSLPFAAGFAPVAAVDGFLAACLAACLLSRRGGHAGP